MPETLPTSDVIRNAYPLKWKNRTIIECGAAKNGQETSPLAADNRCWFIEADPDYFAELSRHTGGVRTLNYALTDYDGEITFNQSSLYGNGSVKYSETHLRELESAANKTTVIRVPCVTYRTLVERHCLGAVDCLVLDIEGNEATVLKSMAPLPAPPSPAAGWRWWPFKSPPQGASLPAIVVIECGYDWSDRLKLLRELGYRLDFYHYNNAFLSQPAAGIAKDAAYIDRVKWNKFEWFGKVIYDADAERAPG